MNAEVVKPTLPARPASDVDAETLKGPLPSVDEICDGLTNIGEQALQTNDFLSYSTVLDMMIGDPKRFTDDEAVQVLTRLHETLSASDALVYNVAWDIPEILLRYLGTFNSATVRLTTHKPLRIVMDLFSLLSERGNPHELFLKAAELIVQFGSTELSNNLADLDARTENVKFCALFELMQFSMKRIETKSPSKFLLEAATALLAVSSSPNIDILTLTTCLRRMYLLARDFSMEGEAEWSAEELGRLRTILTSFLTYAVESALMKYPLHWAERLYLQIVNKLQLASPEVRATLYRESEHTTKLAEAVDRIYMLLLSYDFDPMDYTHQVCSDDAPLGVKVDENRLRDQERDLTDLAHSPLLNGPSLIGCVFLTTHSHFTTNRAKDAHLQSNIAATRVLMEEPSAGVFDVILYWALWMTQYINESMLETAQTADVDRYLDTLFYLSATATTSSEKVVVCSVILRVLRARKFNFSLDLLLRCLKEHHLESQDTSEACARILIALVRGKASCRMNPVSEADLKHDQPRVLSEEQKSEVLTTVGEVIDEELAADRLPQIHILSILSLVNSNKAAVTKLCDKVDNALASRENSKDVQNVLAVTATLRNAEVVSP